MKKSLFNSAPSLVSLGILAGFLVFLSFSLLKPKLLNLLNLPETLFRKGSETNLNLPAAGKTKTEYQAVFLTNGQVYFGKLEGFMTKEPRLTDVYYLRVQKTLQPSEQAPEGAVRVEEKKESALPTAAPKAKNELTLIKLGDEVHGPKDELSLNPQHILFVENLKEDSKVVKAIKEFKEKSK